MITDTRLIESCRPDEFEPEPGCGGCAPWFFAGEVALLDIVVPLADALVVQPEAFERSLRAFSQRMPFQPFAVELVSGTRITVDHPEALVFRGGLAVYIAPDGTPALFDHERVSQLSGISGGSPSSQAA